MPFSYLSISFSSFCFSSLVNSQRFRCLLLRSYRPLHLNESSAHFPRFINFLPLSPFLLLFCFFFVLPLRFLSPPLFFFISILSLLLPLPEIFIICTQAEMQLWVLSSASTSTTTQRYF